MRPILAYSIGFIFALWISGVCAKLCDLREYKKSYFEGSAFYLKCVPIAGTRWQQGIGLWKRYTCPSDDEAFDELTQSCLTVKQKIDIMRTCLTFKRGCPVRQCEAKSYTQAIKTCSWLEEPLRTYKRQKSAFLQCVPKFYNHGCGIWVVRDCAEGSMFDQGLQACVRDYDKDPCFEYEIPLTDCHPSTLCPGGLPCRGGVCCHPRLLNQYTAQYKRYPKLIEYEPVKTRNMLS